MIRPSCGQQASKRDFGPAGLSVVVLLGLLCAGARAQEEDVLPSHFLQLDLIGGSVGVVFPFFPAANVELLRVGFATESFQLGVGGMNASGFIPGFGYASLLPVHADYVILRRPVAGSFSNATSPVLYAEGEFSAAGWEETSFGDTPSKLGFYPVARLTLGYAVNRRGLKIGAEIGAASPGLKAVTTRVFAGIRLGLGSLSVGLPDLGE